MSVRLGYNSHGKGRVRVVKVIKQPDGVNHIHQMNVQILLEGDGMTDAFTDGNNKNIVATDTCKNTAYCVAASNNFSSIEEYGILLAKHFLSEYSKIVNRVSIDVIADVWERITAPDSRGSNVPHKHVFRRIGPKKPFTKVRGEKRPHTALSLSLRSGFFGLEILKTTQSGFSDFYRDRYTSLPDVSERLVGTSVTATWEYSDSCLNRFKTLDFNKISAIIERSLVNTFAGPSDKGVFSPSVQQTLYEMGKASILATPQNVIDRITLEMPNIHNIPFPLENYGFSNKDPVTDHPFIFYPIDEPHGMIKAVIERSSAPRSKL